MSKLFVIGAGPGAMGQMTLDAMEKLCDVSCVVVAPRLRHILDKLDELDFGLEDFNLAGKKVILLENFSTALESLSQELNKNDAAVLVSGDPGIYSLLPLLKKRFADTCEIKVLPGLSALQCICAEVGETWADAAILSGHGRGLPVSRMLNAIECNRLTIIFCDETHSPGWILKSLANAAGGLGDRVEAIIGERLSAPDQRVTRGRPSDLLKSGLKSGQAIFDANFDSMAIVLVRNEKLWARLINRPRDEDFVRGDVPMTRCEVRSAILDHLELTPNAIMWDIGAGTGSVTVAAALALSANSGGEVHAVEFAPAALELLKQNRDKFHVHNIIIHEGHALELMHSGKLPRPTHVFIGGSGGELENILAYIANLARDIRDCDRDLDHDTSIRSIRVVISAVTLDTLSTAVRILNDNSWRDFEAVQISVSRSRTIGRTLESSTGSILMAAQNPVTLLCANTNDK